MMRQKVKFGGFFTIECVRRGQILWRDTAFNLVCNVGLQHILDVTFCSGSQVTTWYVGLAGSSPSPAAGDTLASHGGWTEFTNLSSARISWGMTRSSQTVSNSSALSFTINADTQTVGGAFVCSAASGTSGTLVCAAAFSGGNKSGLMTNDVLNVTYSFTAADDGA